MHRGRRGAALARRDLSSLPAWSGTVERIRIDPMTHGDGNAIRVDNIVLSP